MIVVDSSSNVNAMLGRLDRIFTPVSLTRREYCATIERCADQGVSGGRLIMRSSSRVHSEQADEIYTLNGRNFRALARAEEQRKIIEP
jgi:hypothetical protein